VHRSIVGKSIAVNRCINFKLLQICDNNIIAIPSNSGINAAFSMGSHAQYPPQPRDSYAHIDPVRIPAQSKIEPKLLYLIRSGVNL